MAAVHGGAGTGCAAAPAAPLSAVLARSLAARGVRACAFDFDRTLLRIHSVGQRIEAAAVPQRDLAADFCDLAFVRELFPALAAAGIAAHILSFGKYPVIQAYMDGALGSGVFTRATISTPSVVGVPDGCSVTVGPPMQQVSSKVPQLRVLVAALGVPAGAVLFLDGAWPCGCAR